MKQKGEGNGIDSVSERDRETVINDPHSKIAPAPKDMECIVILNVYNQVQKVSSGMGSVSLNYEHMKDLCSWNHMSKKKYIPLIMNCHNSFMSGVNSKRG